MDISKAFNTGSRLLLIEMTHHSRLRQFGDVACGISLSAGPLAFPPGAGGVPQESVISQAFFNHFVSNCPIPDLDMTSYADDFALLASVSSLVEAEARVNQLCSSLVRWADGKQLAIAPQKSSVTLFTSDTHQSDSTPQERIGDAGAPLNRTLKILGVTLDTHFTFGRHASDCVERASRALNVMKALAGLNWGFTTETLVAIYKATKDTGSPQCPQT